MNGGWLLVRRGWLGAQSWLARRDGRLFVACPISSRPLKSDRMLTRRNFSLLPLAYAISYGQDRNAKKSVLRQSEGKQYYKSSAATKAIPADFGDATLWLDPAKWIEYNREPGAIRYNHINKHVLGWMLADRTGGIRTSAMKNMVLRNAQRVDPNVRVTLDDHRVVNGREVLYVEYLLTQNSVPVRFAGYYQGGLKSNLQIVAYCVAAEFETQKDVVDEFINGIEIREASSPDPRP